MHTDSIDEFRHEHVFLGAGHARNERKTWTVIERNGTTLSTANAAGTDSWVARLVPTSA